MARRGAEAAEINNQNILSVSSAHLRAKFLVTLITVTLLY
jgi:hypothetical protein